MREVVALTENLVVMSPLPASSVRLANRGVFIELTQLMICPIIFYFRSGPNKRVINQKTAMHPIKHMRTLVTFIFLLTMRLGAAAPEVSVAKAVAITPNGTAPAFFAHYGIACQAFAASRENPLENSAVPPIAEALANAQMLFFARSTYGTEQLFANEQCRTALTDFLARGGLLFFRYQGLPEGSHVTRFFEQVGAMHPGQAEGAYYTSKLHDNVDLFTIPNPLESEPQGYGWWTHFGTNAHVLASPMGVENGAAMLEYRVEGNGRIILSRLFKLYADQTKAMENLLVSVFGKHIIERGVGGITPLYEPYEREQTVNPLHFSELGGKPWHEPRCAMRTPLILKEPVGLERKEHCVTLPLPQGAEPRSIRATTVAGFDVPFQVTGSNLILQVELYPHMSEGYFIYWNSIGAAQKALPASETASSIATIRATDTAFALANDNLKISLDRKRGAFTQFSIQGGSGNNQIAVYGRRMGTHPSNYIYDSGDSVLESARIIEPGPLRVSVEYAYTNAGRIVYRLEAGSHLITEEIEWNGAALRKRMHWAPYGDTQQDHFYYRTADGIKAFRCVDGPLASPGKAMIEGWYAIADERGESVGEFFDPNMHSGLQLYGHTYGLNVCGFNRAPKRQTCKKAFTAVRGSWEDVRRAYVGWRNPPTITLGERQERIHVTPTVPKLGEDSLRMYYIFPMRIMDRIPENFVAEAMEMGANYLALTAYIPHWKTQLYPNTTDIIGPITRIAHEQGLGVYVNLVHDAKFVAKITPEDDTAACMLTHRDLYLETYREIAREDVDGISLSDEGYLAVSEEAMRKEFEKRTQFTYDDALSGMRGREFDISNPATAELALIRMELYNEHKRAMTEAIREIKPDIIVSRLFSPNNHSGIGSFDDLETDGEYFSCASTDLYSTDVSATLFMTQWTRAMGGNSRSHAPINFTGCIWEKQRLWDNQLQHLFAGSCNFLHFDGGFNVAVPRSTIEVKRFYNWIDFTGLGDLIAHAEPAKHLAILWAREAFKASVRHGERSTGTIAPVFYERPIEELIRLPNSQADILFGSFFRQPDVVNQYPVVLIPSGWTLSDGMLEAMERYARQGGDIIICGLSLTQPGVAALAGVTAGETLTHKRTQITGTANVPPNIDQTLALDSIALEPGEKASVLLVDKYSGASLATMVSCGEGRIIALAAAYGYAPLIPELCNSLGRPVPFRLTGDNVSQLYGNMIEGDGYRVLALCNMSSITPAECVVQLYPAPPANAQIIEMTTGKVYSWTPDFKVSVAPGALAFLYIAGREERIIPITTDRPTPMDKQRPMEFLRQLPTAQTTASVDRDPDKIYVGVFRGEGKERERSFEKGSRMIIESLTGKPDLNILVLNDLTDASLSDCDVVIVPNIGHPKIPLNLNDNWIPSLRRFAEKGGGVLLCHHAIGWTSLGGNVFPEVGSIRSHVTIQEMRTIADHPVITGQTIRTRFKRFVEDPAFADEYSASFMAPETLFQASFVDYMSIAPNDGAEVLARSIYNGTMKQGEDPVLVAGTFGKGRVLLSGLAIGFRISKNAAGEWVEEDFITTGEKKILVNAAYWLQRVKAQQ